MSYEETSDVEFNSKGDALPEASDLFQDLGVELRYFDLPFGNPSLERGSGDEADLPLRPDGTLGPDAGTRPRSRRARVAHLPQPAQPIAVAAEMDAASTSKAPFLYEGWTERDIAEELLTPETFYWWKARDALAERGMLPDVPKIYPSNMRQHQTPWTPVTNKRTLRWEDLSLGVRWLIILRLSEQRPFTTVIIWQLDLSKHQVHEFVTSYINFCDQWNAFEHSVADRVKAFGGCGEQQDMLLVNWIHEHRPLMPHDRITKADADMGLVFLHERGIVNHNVDLQEWVDEQDPKGFARIRIDLPTLRDCMDYRLLRRVAVARLLHPSEVEEVIREQGRDKCRNDYNTHKGNPLKNNAFLGTIHQLSTEARSVLNTISTDLRVCEPMPMPIPGYQRQEKRQEAHRALKRMVPELQPQTAPGGLAKTQWEIDNGYPHGYNWEYTPLHHAEDAADMEPSLVPEELTTQKRSRIANVQRGIIQRQVAKANGTSDQTPLNSPGRQSPEQGQRYEESSPTQSSVTPLRNNAPRSRIGTARERFMTSNSKGQLMVGIVADIPSVTGETPQNPGFVRQFAELGCCSQPEVQRAAEGEPESELPDLNPAEDLEPDANVMLERSKRKRRPSARARESLQYAMEMEQCAETNSEKLQGKKARPPKPKRRQADEAKDCQSPQGPKGSKGSQGSQGSQGSEDGSKPAQETDAKERGKTAVTAPRVQTRGSLADSYAAAQEPPLPVVTEVTRLEEEDQCNCILQRPGESGSEMSTDYDIQQRPCRRRNCKIRRLECHFGMLRGEQINTRPPPVAVAEYAWAADEAGFAVEAVRACYALTADRINTELLVPRHNQMDLGTARTTIISAHDEYSQIERLHRSENGPIAEKAGFAGVTDTATFAVHAIEASAVCTGALVIDEADDGLDKRQLQPAD
ncbi:hypothetical protein V8C35DRAFT_325223 [Trichoderma chlorosporum]